MGIWEEFICSKFLTYLLDLVLEMSTLEILRGGGRGNHLETLVNSSERVDSPFLNVNALGRKAYLINLAINPIINQMLFSQFSVNGHSFTKCVLNADYKPVIVLNLGNIKSPVSIL